MPLDAPRIEAIRTACYAALGAGFLATGLWVLATGAIPPVPAWSYPAAGLGVAALLLAVSAAAPGRAVDAAYDEGASTAWLRAQAFGYWAAIACFVVLGNLAALGALPPGAAFLGAGMLASAAPFAHYLIAEWRRGRM